MQEWYANVVQVFIARGRTIRVERVRTSSTVSTVLVAVVNETLGLTGKQVASHVVESCL
jgi:hypothetical protein